MPSTRISVPLFALLSIGYPTFGQDAESNALVETSVVYARGMLVCVAKEGVAAVRFLDPFSLGNETGNGVVGVSYEWRFLAAEDLDGGEKRGSGKLFAKLEDGQQIRGSSDVECGPIELKWRTNDDRTGFIEYDPMSVHVHPVSVSYFQERPAPAQDAGGPPPLDLRCFMQADLEVIEQLQKRGTDANPRRHRGDTAGFVLYGESVTLVKDPFGVAVFEFGEAYERETSPNEKRHGVDYRFAFFPQVGEPQTGEGEVYEFYKNGDYNEAESRLILQAGPMRVVWSRGGREGGWLYYHPSWTRVWTCKAAEKEQLLRAVRDQPDGLFVPPQAPENRR